MVQKLPALQEKVVAFLPRLNDALVADAGKAPPANWREHDIYAMVQNEFAGPNESLMGALVAAYVKPYLCGEKNYTSEVMPALETCLTGNVDVYPGMDKVSRSADDSLFHLPLIRGRYNIHRVTKDVLGKTYDEDTAARLANTLSILSYKDLPLGAMIGADMAQESINLACASELERLKQEGRNPFSGYSILEIGGAAHERDMPQFAFFDYKNISAGTQYAHTDSAQYVSLRNMPEGLYDYVITSNAISLEVPRNLKDGSIFQENGDLFCCCANSAKPGAKIYHMTEYDPTTSPVLSDRQLHTFSGVVQDFPEESAGVDPLRWKQWSYTKSEHPAVTYVAYVRWGRDNHKFSQWETQVKTKKEAERSFFRR